MKKIYFLFLLLSSTVATFGQFNYLAANAQNVAGSYTDLGSAGTAITTNFTGSTMTFDDDNSSIQNIGFNFTFNGIVFTQFVLNSNGFIKLGTVPPANANEYDVLGSNETNTIAPFNNDLDGAIAPEYRVATSGSIGSRICTIQFKNLEDFSFTTGQYSNINFQIRLFEGSNNIEFVYGTFTPSAAASNIFAVVAGIKGGDAATSVNATKASVDAWSTATFINGDYTANAFNTRNSVLPVPGITLRFVAVSLPNNDAQVMAVYTLGQLPIPYGSPQVVQARIKNAGGATITNLVVTLNVTGANPFTNSKTVTITPGSIALINFDPFSPVSTGNNTVTVSVPADDNNANNSSSYAQAINANLFSYADNSATAGSVGYANGAGLILVKYTATGSLLVSSVRVNLSSDPTTTGNTVYAVVLNAAGTIVGQSAPYVIAAGDLGTYKNFALLLPPAFINTSFYVGLAQTANVTTAYFPVSYQPETLPTRAGAYYTAPLLGGVPTENTAIGRFMIQAIISAALPVTVTVFEARRNSSVNILTWSTSQEINSNLFIIERSADSRNFTQLGQVAAAGNSSTLRNYQFTDANPFKGINYYRLRIVDLNANTKFTDVRSVNNGGSSAFGIYPNPVSKEIKVEINAEKSDKGNMIITNIDGKLVYTRSVIVAPGNNIFTADISNLSTGSYIVKVELTDNTVVKKFIKL